MSSISQLLNKSYPFDKTVVNFFTKLEQLKITINIIN